VRMKVDGLLNCLVRTASELSVEAKQGTL
jgi:hypothetical protein